MKQYYINEFIYVCYSYESSKLTTEYGVLKPYIGKLFNREQIDVIIAKMITHHPYVEGAMRLEITVVWTENGASGDYHRLVFRNDNYKQQSKGNLSIKYEMTEDEVNNRIIGAKDFKQRIKTKLIQVDNNIKDDDLYFSQTTIGYCVAYKPDYPKSSNADIFVYQDLNGLISMYGNSNSLIPTIKKYKDIDDFENDLS